MSQLLADYQDTNIVQSTDYLKDILPLLVKGKVLLVTSKGFARRGLVTEVIGVLGAKRVAIFDQVTPNPEVSFVKQHYQKFLKLGVTNVLAIGGGSVIDTAKVFSAMLSYEGKSLEQLLSSNDLQCKVNLIAVPTTSGTGAEVTPFATVWESETYSKYSLYGIRPTIALLDPKLTLTLPYTETLYPALDALSHALESIWNKNRTTESQFFAEQCIECVCEFLPVALAQPNNLKARKHIQLAAAYAGMAIAITKTAIAHAISYPLTLQHEVPHGLACSFTLLAILEHVGADNLNISTDLVDKVTNLLLAMKLDREIANYVEWPYLIENFDPALDPTRAGNFIMDFSDLEIKNIVKSSALESLG